ncbi:MAG TPA: NTP transferase domain-containing protein [Acidimicrobiales bacterium]|nr:NTP transferase domain-containing protein [Acidimicrobiales bacterium]
MLPPVCILAGGLGTRLGEIGRSTPKALIEVANEPFLVHQIRLLATYGVERVVLCVGHLGEQIEERIGRSREGVAISYSYDSADLDGTLGAIRRARVHLGEQFLVMYGDTYLEINYADFARSWLASNKRAGMCILFNDNQWDRSNVNFQDDKIIAYDKFAPTEEMSWIDFGLGALKATALDVVSPAITDLAELYHRLSRSGELYGYEATERFHEIGTPESLAETDRYLRAKLSQ